MDASSESSGGIGAELNRDAHKMGGSVKDRLHSKVDAGKDEGTSQAKGLSSALDKAASELGPDSPAWIKSALQQGAGTLQQFADAIDQRDSRQLTRDVRRLAGDYPATFLAGCALAGFAAARVFKAGAGQAADGAQSRPDASDPYAPATAGQEQPAMPFSSTGTSAAMPAAASNFGERS